MSAKRHGAHGTKVAIADTWMTGRTGHTAFSNAWMIVAAPEDDIDGITREIVAGNDGIADQLLVRESLANSFDRIADFEAMGMKFARNADGKYARRPTRATASARQRSNAAILAGCPGRCWTESTCEWRCTRCG